jgi:hypothetical protein
MSKFGGHVSYNALPFGGCLSNLARVDWRTSTDLDVRQQTSGYGAFKATCRLAGTNIPQGDFNA